MYKILLDEYIYNSVNIDHVSDIRDTFLTDQRPDYDLFNFKIIGFYLKNFWSDDSKDLAELMRCFPDNKFAYFFYKLSEHKIVNKVQKIILKDIRTNEILYIEREIFDEVMTFSEEYKLKWKVLNKDFNFNIYNDTYFRSLDLSSDEIEKKFGIRFLCDSKLNILKLVNNTSEISEFVKDRFRKVIFHIHGGGFITMSSASHQLYLTKFAKETGACIFSIDYPKAPHFKYKEIVQCVFKAYLFVIVF